MRHLPDFAFAVKFLFEQKMEITLSRGKLSRRFCLPAAVFVAVLYGARIFKVNVNLTTVRFENYWSNSPTPFQRPVQLLNWARNGLNVGW